MKEIFKHFFKEAIEWLFRRRSRPILIMRFGIVCLSLALGGAGWVLYFSLHVQDGQVAINVNSTNGTPAVIVYLAAIIGVVLITVGLIRESRDNKVKQRCNARRKVIVIEARGLRDSDSSPLICALPLTLKGQREQIFVDLRQRVKDGEIVAPEAALNDLISLPTDIRRRKNGIDRRDITLVYGGLTPVPFTFLTGVLMDDEEKVLIFDWDRHKQIWRDLGHEDDGKRFQIPDLTKVILDSSKEVALVVSISYRVILEDVKKRIGDMPVVEIILDGGSPDCHWSEDKQRALGQQFLNTAIELSNNRIEYIHLFLAAQNSVVFRFGRLYDKRNLPKLVVYQFQRNQNLPYPWGVLMPVCGVEQPLIVSNK